MAAAKDMDLSGLPETAPPKPTKPLRFADIAVTATAKEFAGIYRGRQCHEPDFAATLPRAASAGVEKVMLTGMSLDDVDFNTKLVEQHPTQCSLTIGIHPYHAAIQESDVQGEMARLEQCVDKAVATTPRPISAFGELGLDYDRTNHASKEDQLRVFRAQMDLVATKQWDLPLFLHCRAACDDFIEMISPYLPQLKRKGIVHSFVGSTAEMHKLLDLGLDISVNAFSFADRESVDMVAAMPLKRLHLETDSPWGEIKSTSPLATRYCTNAPGLPSSKKRDKWDPAYMVKERNESCTIAAVAFIVAGLKGLSVAEVASAVWENSNAMFNFTEVN
ncbi:Mg-dependent DNase [Hortaea werneckii]|nr:Mg-dependent DNase [Hortaea werneckii]KAI7323813.1 Mg-dependent DNase [Hortaea werneckii]